MSTKSVAAVFEKYQKERLVFAQQLCELATRENNVELLLSGGALALLRPLLLDNIPPIQQAAANALAKIATVNEKVAADIIKLDILPHLTFKFAEQNKYFKKAAACALRAVSRHSAELAKAVVDQGGLVALVVCCQDHDNSIKESGIWGIGYIARHSIGILYYKFIDLEELARKVIQTDTVGIMVNSLSESDTGIHKVSLSALGDICKHSADLAQFVVDFGILPRFASLINNEDPKIRRQALTCLCQIAKHTVDLAESVIDAEIFPNVLLALKDTDLVVRKNAVTLLCELSKHSAELIVNAGAVAPIIDFLNETQGIANLTGVMALGYISAFSETLALAVIMAKGVKPIIKAISTSDSHQVKSACAWVLGQIGRHTPEHAKAVAENGGLSALVNLYKSTDDSSQAEDELDIQTKTKRALKCIVEKTLTFDALEPMLTMLTPIPVLKTVIVQFSKILPNDVSMRRLFVTSGALHRLQEIASATKKDPASVSMQIDEVVNQINKCFPDEVIKYYTPGYSETLLQKVETFTINEKMGSVANLIGPHSELGDQGGMLAM